MKPFDDVYAKVGDDIQIAFTAYDRNGNEIDISSAEATFRVAKKGFTENILELTEIDGITLAGSVATCAFNTQDLEMTDFCDDEARVFEGQLRITKSGKAMVSAFGEIKVSRLIK